MRQTNEGTILAAHVLGPAWLEVTGASTHNLKQVDVKVPHGVMVAFTGRSGSGKSSLVIDTFLAEAVRRSSLSMSAYARQFVEQFPKPPYATMSGLRTAVYLEQGKVSRNPRSTLGTLTELYDGLRILMARFGIPDCPDCGGPMRPRPESWECFDGHTTAPRLDPKDFSFNLPFGSCQECEGAGARPLPAPTRLVDPTRSVIDGALKPYEADRWRQVHREVAAQVVAVAGAEPSRPFHDLPVDLQRVLLESPALPITMTPPSGQPYETEFMGVGPWVEAKFRSAASDGARGRFAQFLTVQTCPSCAGARLGPSPLRYRLHGWNMTQLVTATLTELAAHLDAFGRLPAARPAQSVLQEMHRVSDRLIEIGVGYLDLARSAPTLSGGEQQRTRLALQLGADLHGLMYVLDEPSNGLHPADVQKLATTLSAMTAQGNTLLLVEHDPELVREGGWLVDLGPGAGTDGGRVLYSGPMDEVPNDTVTGPFITGTAPMPPRRDREPTSFLTVANASIHNVNQVTVGIARTALTCIIGPSGSGKSSFVYGVMRPALTQLGITEEGDSPAMFGGLWTGVDGTDGIERICMIDQTPVGRTPRSNPATFSGAFDVIRKVFATSPGARDAGLTAAHFSFNTAEGRCPACNGEGFNRIEMGFHPDVFVTCPVCGGRRYQPNVLACTLDGLTISDVLDLPVDEAAARYESKPKVVDALRPLQEAGLGYIKLGQPAPTLSGGEAQRLKLAKELAGPRPDRTLYLIDEPTSGLHPIDVDEQLAVMHRLVDAGATVVVIEHDPRFICGADWVVEFGPGAGPEGGRIVASGTPRLVAASKQSVTGPFLTPYLQ